MNSDHLSPSTRRPRGHRQTQKPHTIEPPHHTPGDWQLNADQIISVHTDEDGEHETLIADVFREHDWWRANATLLTASPTLLEALLNIRNLAQKSRDCDADPFALLDLIACEAMDAIHCAVRE
jgi:hypothetical protein